MKKKMLSILRVSFKIQSQSCVSRQRQFTNTGYLECDKRFDLRKKKKEKLCTTGHFKDKMSEPWDVRP